MLRAEGLVKSYNGRRVVDDVSLEIERGTVVGLLGPNGAGKTTTFHMILGIVSAERGHVYLDDMKIDDLPFHRRVRRGIGFLAQVPSVFRKMTVEQNLMAILEHQEGSPQQWAAKAETLLRDLDLIDLRHQKAHTLSGGERRRVEIARSLVASPAFMLLDEPFSGIDPISIEEIQELILSLKRRNIGIVVTDHNVRETLEITDRAYLINQGRVLMSGTPDEITSDPRARKFYLGERFRM
ncbi:MAG: LPS export ABC transporter ATP-binding protein [Candidatus Bipolaricaulia bacterium]